MIGGDQGDELTGGTADDVLYGGQGNDKLTGGAGDDLLIGGKGEDSYYFRLADGGDTDTIVDSGKNTLYVQRASSGKDVIVKSVFGVNAGINGYSTYNTIDGEVIITVSNNRTELPNGSHVEFRLGIKNFDIKWINIPDTPVTTNTIHGSSGDSLPNYPKILHSMN